MNVRERVLLIVLFAILIVGGGGALFYYGFFQDYMESRRQLNETEAKIQEKKRELDTIESDRKKLLDRNPRLEHWQKLSLPDLARKPGSKSRNAEDAIKHQKEWAVKYSEYLIALLKDSGFVSSSISITAKTPDTKVPDAKGGAPAKDKVPVYTRLPFAIQGTASYKAIIDMLKSFYSEPLLQEVRSLSITKPVTPRPNAPQDALDVTMTVEVLLVTGAESRNELRPKGIAKGDEHVLAQPKRVYDEMLAKDLFFGKKGSSPERQSEDRKLVLNFVKLTSITWNSTDERWRATFYDQGQGPPDTEHVVSSRKFLNDLVIKDAFGQESFAGKCVYLDSNKLVMEDKEGRYYLMHVGDVLHKALEKQLEDADLPKYDLKPKKVAAIKGE
jgi:hypothetical protein